MTTKAVAGLFMGVFVAAGAQAAVVSGSFSGTISDSLTRGTAVVPGGIVDGDPFTLSFSYNTDLAVVLINQSPSLNLYGFDSPTDSWIRLSVGGLTWESQGHIAASVYNDYSGNPNHSIDQFRMSFQANEGSSFPGFIGLGEVEWAITAAYAPGTSPSLVTSVDLPQSIEDLALNEVNDTYSSITSRTSNGDIWLYRLKPDLTTFQMSSVPAPIPEPETYVMFLAGLGLVGFVASRRKVT